LPAEGAPALEQHVRRLPGVRHVAVNLRTGNVLIQFDPRAADTTAILAALVPTPPAAAEPPSEAPLPPALDEERQGSLHRARIAVRGLDRDPRLARRVVERLRRLFGVRAEASPLTGRVVVDYDEDRVDLHELLARVAEVELPDLPGEDRPAHPLDRAPLLHGAARTAGVALGLGVLVVRRLLGWAEPSAVVRRAATVAGVISLLRSFPLLRSGLRRLLGRHAADLASSLATVASLTLARGVLGLAVTGTEGLLLLTEVLARRSSWRRYEAGLRGAASAHPGSCIRLEAGEVTPLAAHVLEGTGTALGRDGMPRPVAPGCELSAGARLVGGTVVLQLEGGRPFEPRPRPAPLAPSLYTRYLGAVTPLSLAYAALTAVRTRSLARVFEALLLVNPRPAIIGMEAANLDAAAHVLRRGVIVVGTRPRRAVRLPDTLLLDGPRVLTDGLEVAEVLDLEEGRTAEEIRALAGGVAAAADSPWGNAFGRAGAAPATAGCFNGLWASAAVDGVGYTLGPPEDPPELPAAAQVVEEGGYLLALGLDVGLTLGYVVLRPRLSPGAVDLVGACRRLGVGVEMLPGGAPRAAQAVARRAGVPLADSADAVEVIRARQRAGRFVAFVSDSAHAAPAFADCDLAVGLLWQQASRFPARADLLAADLGSVTAVLEAGARRERSVRDGVALSALANVAGALAGLWGDPGVVNASRGVYLAALGALADGWARLRGGGAPPRS
jgi:cation transport ATPase